MTNKKEVYHVRLVNGDEILGRLAENLENDYIILHDVLTVDEIKENGQSTIFLSKYSLDVGDKIELLPQHVVTITKVVKTIEDYYVASLKYSSIIEIQKLNEIKKITNNMNESLKSLTVSEYLTIKEPNQESILVPSSNSIN